MKKITFSGAARAFLALMLVVGLSACGGGSGGSDNNTQPPPPPAENPIDALWEATVSSYLAEDLWIPEFDYDASHLLMVPLYYAFQLEGTAEQKQDFHDFFERYAANVDDKDPHLQRRLLFYFLTVNYLTWCGCEADPALLSSITNDSISIWNEQPNTTWGGGPFDSYKESISWKVAGGPDGTISYGKAMFDAEILLLAVGSRLKVLQGSSAAPELTEMSDKALEMIENLGQFSGDAWVFQPGVWWEFEDYQYAGHQELLPELEPSPVEGIATDSSHIARMPLWLDAFIAANNNDVLVRAKSGFIKQFETAVLEKADQEFTAPRITNYFDGTNGLYRYGYSTLSGANAYQAYQLSGALVSNWYAFMGSEELKSEFSQVVDNLPLAQNVVELYSGPSNDIEQHPLVKFPNYFENGFAELYMRIALQM